MDKDVGWLHRWAVVNLARTSLQLRAQILIVLTCLGLVALEGDHAWKDRANRLREAQDTNYNLSLSLMQHTEDAIGIAGAALISLVERVEREGVWPAAISGLKQQMAAYVAHSPRLSSLALVDEDGYLMASSAPTRDATVKLSDRAHFQHHRADPSRDVHLDGPVTSHLDGSWIITVSRRVQHPDGSFAGVVLATLSSEQFARHYAGFDIGTEGSIALLRSDGTLLSRTPYDPGQIGRSYAKGELFRTLLPRSPSGSYYSASAIDGVKRVGGYSSGGSFPLVIIAVSAVDHVLSGWMVSTAQRLAGIGLLAGLLGWFGTRLAQQVNRRQDAERALRESETNFRLLTEMSNDMVTRVGLDGLRSYVSPASTRLLGWAPEELIGSRALGTTHPDDQQRAQEVLTSVVNGTVENTTYVYRATHRDGREIWIEASLQSTRDDATGCPNGLVGISRDITERKLLEQQLAVLATTDGLTGLANRRRFDEAITMEWRRAVRDGTEVSLALIDVDRFKAFNDRYGHQAGDECLRDIAGTLAGATHRPADLAARYGGEELAALLPGTDARGANDVAESIRAAIQALAIPHNSSAPALVVTVSIGVATAMPMADVDPAAGVRALLAIADEALYEAKRSGRNRVVRAGVGAARADDPPCDWAGAGQGARVLHGT